MKKTDENLRIKIALDTQILAYLIDNSYPDLTYFIKVLSKNPCVDIVCSRFAIYEFIGIRKLEHYLRCIVDVTTKTGGSANFSSILKNKNGFDASELKYKEIYETIKERVEKELIRIDTNFGIIYESFDLHNSLWKPQQEFVLSTRISKEDCLLLLSSVFPDSLHKEKYSVLLTNDRQFYDAICGADEIEICEDIFRNNGLTKPNMYHLKKVILNDGSDQLNLIDHNKKIEEERIQSFTTHFILDHIKNKNKESFFLGEVIRCACRRELRGRILCFKMEKEQELIKDMYITIMTKGFQIYNHHMKLSNFKSYGDLELPYKPNEDEKSREISIELVDINGNPLEEGLMKNITSPGNLVFIHPDSFR